MRKVPTVLELETLQNRLREAEETLSAIRSGEVDSLVVAGPSGLQVFSLRGAEQPYRIFVEQMQQGAVTMTPDGIILYANRRMAELLATSLERLIGTQITAFLVPADHALFLAALASPGGKRLDLVLHGTGPVALPVSIALSELPIEDATGVCAVITDLTADEHKRELTAALARLTDAQSQLHTQNEQLKRARAEAEAARVEAEEARRQAEYASEAKDEFLATLSHELRTPLTPVLVAVQSLESEPNLPRIAADLSMICRNIELEARLIDDLLDLTRIVRGKVELRMEDADLRRIAEHVLEIHPDLHDSHITLVSDLGPLSGAPHVRGDPVRVQQILWNLVRNAIKFTPSGGTVTLRLVTTASRSIPQAHIAISDTGIGMNAATIARIFSPFEQAGRDITRRFGGLGLGLAISRKLAEMHGGSISAASPGTGKGSTFTLSLPLLHRAAVPPAAPGLDPAIGANAPRSGALDGTHAATRRFRILLVEDHDDTRKSMTRLLSLEHEVRAAHSVASALETAGESTFDLLISDLGLPDGTGHELMREIRRRHGDIQAIALSGYGMDADIAHSKDAGFHRHLTKPVSLTSLKAAISEVTTA